MEVQERERLQLRFKTQLKEYVNAIMKSDSELQLDQKIGLCFFDMQRTTGLSESQKQPMALLACTTEEEECTETVPMCGRESMLT